MSSLRILHHETRPVHEVQLLVLSSDLCKCALQFPEARLHLPNRQKSFTNTVLLAAIQLLAAAVLPETI